MDELEHYKLQMRIMTDLINVRMLCVRGGARGRVIRIGPGNGVCGWGLAIRVSHENRIYGCCYRDEGWWWGTWVGQGWGYTNKGCGWGKGVVIWIKD